MGVRTEVLWLECGWCVTGVCKDNLRFYLIAFKVCKELEAKEAGGGSEGCFGYGYFFVSADGVLGCFQNLRINAVKKGVSRARPKN